MSELFNLIATGAKLELAEISLVRRFFEEGAGQNKCCKVNLINEEKL